MRGHRPLFWLALVFGLAVGFVIAVFPHDVEAARNSSGTYSRPSGNPVVAGTTVTSTWANTLTSDVATELTDSLSRSGKGPMLAALELVNGSVGTPALSFDSDTDVGLYRIGANNPGFSVGGTKVQEWSTTTATFPLACTVTGVLTVAGGTVVTQSTVNGVGLVVTGNGTGRGITATGGSDGEGIRATGMGTAAGGNFFGGATDGDGVSGTGAGAGRGAVFVSGTTADEAVSISHGTNATGGARQDAVRILNGDIQMNDVADPTSTTSLTDRLTPVSFVKVWANITGGATPSVNAGLNVASVSCGANQITVTVAGDFSGNDYAISAVTDQAGAIPHVNSAVAGSFVIGATLHDGSTVNLCSGTPRLHVMAIGAQ